MDRVELLSRPAPIARRRIEVHGIVQGVGFRPFVYRLARELALDGWVRNDAAGVTIEVQGDAARIDEMHAPTCRRAPRRWRASIASTARGVPAERASAGLRDPREPTAVARATAIGPDTATCDDCLAELFAPARPPLPLRVHQLHELRTAVHDHAQRSPTTGRRPAWRASPSARNAPPSTAHPATGASTPSRTPARSAGRGSRCVDARGAPIEGVDPIADDRRAGSRAGEIVAIKGLGGFHLACDARNAGAVARLRERKAREEKPFAVMVANAHPRSGSRRCRAGERALLESPRAADRAAAQARRRRRAAARHRAGPRLARRHAAVHAAAVPAVPRERGAARRDALARRSAGTGAGDDERQSRRRAAGDRQRRGAGTARRHRRRLPRPRPRHRRPLRRQRRARGSGSLRSSSGGRAATRPARSGSRPRDRRSSRSAAISRARCA